MVLARQIDAHRALEPALVTEPEIRFVPAGTATRVEF
jgi:hypothetical protein